MKNRAIELIIKEFETNKIKKTLASNQEIWLSCSGNSMSHALKNNWKLKIKNVRTDEINIGDIIVFGRVYLVCHRVAAKLRLFKKIYFIQKGDNVIVGNIINANSIVGKVEKVLDEEKREIDKASWQCYTARNQKFLLLGYIFLLFSFVKRLIFKTKRNKFTDLLKQFFWKMLVKPMIGQDIFQR